MEFVHIFGTAWNFLTKFWCSDWNLSKNIIRRLYLKFETSAHGQITLTRYSLLETINMFPGKIKYEVETYSGDMHW